jgi:muramoyltetrapeptide carboxypeptidase
LLLLDVGEFSYSMESKSIPTLLKPPRLHPGDTIGIVAPSLPVLPSWQDAYTTGKHVLQSLGFQVKEGRTIGLRRWWSAGTSTDQADDINAMFADHDVHAIVAFTGGFSAMPVLDLLDYEIIRQHPKPFLGMSDITLYHWAMYTKCGLVGFHANDVLDGFGQHFLALQTEQQAQLADLYLRALTMPQAIGMLTPLSSWECWRAGSADGQLIGGNLKRFAALAGTAYFPPLSAFDGALLFWEEIGETLYDIALDLYKLKHIGLFERIAGMVIGKLVWVNEYFPEVAHPSPREAVLEVLKEYDFPILAEVDFGHNMAMLPMPIGLHARIDASTHTLKILEAAVVEACS